MAGGERGTLSGPLDMLTYLSRRASAPLIYTLLALTLLPRQAVPTEAAFPELDAWVERALRESPAMAAARARFARAAAEQRGVGAFFDPALVGVVGQADSFSAIPAAITGRRIDNDTVAGKLAVEAPLKPGGYVSAGAGETWVPEPAGGQDAFRQTIVGARLEVPLWKDRGLAEWRARDREAAERLTAAAQDLLAVAQAVRHDVELAYVDVLHAAAAVDEATASTKRSETLLQQTEQLVALRAVPEYQCFAAATEVQLRREEIAIAGHALHRQVLRLTQLAGGGEPAVVEGGGEKLAAWSAAVRDEPAPALALAWARRGDSARLDSLIRAAGAAQRLALEQARPDVSLAMAASWRSGNGAEARPDAEDLSEDGEAGAEVALVWRQPFGFREERAAADAQRAAMDELEAERAGLRLQIATELANAGDALRSAQARLALVEAAVEAAQQALAAEGERFRLGEGRSRNVVDAQKDLNDAMQRRNNAAAALLRAWCDQRRAGGYEGRMRVVTGNNQNEVLVERDQDSQEMVRPEYP